MVRSTLVQVMAWCRQASSRYLCKCWPRSLWGRIMVTGWFSKRRAVIWSLIFICLEQIYELPVISLAMQLMWRQCYDISSILWNEKASLGVWFISHVSGTLPISTKFCIGTIHLGAELTSVESVVVKVIWWKFDWYLRKCIYQDCS